MERVDDGPGTSPVTWLTVVVHRNRLSSLLQRGVTGERHRRVWVRSRLAEMDPANEKAPGNDHERHGKTVMAALEPFGSNRAAINE